MSTKNKVLIQNKENRIIGTAYTIIFAFFVVAALTGCLYFYAPSDEGFIVLVATSVLCILTSIVCFAWWGMKHHLNRGWKYAQLHSKIYKKLNTALYDSGIYVERCVLMKICAVVPEIQVEIDKDLFSGVIRLQNCVKFDKRLDELPISSALPDRYVVTKSYLADNCNDYVYEFQPFDIEQLVFHCHEEFSKYCLSVGDYNLFLDANRNVPMFHALIIGQTGSGKSYCIYNFVLQMLSKNEPWELYIADPKSSGLYAMGMKINPKHTACQIEEILKLLEVFDKRMQERKTEFGNKLLEKLDSDYRDFGLRPICLIIDEYSSFHASLSRYDKKTRDRADEIIGNAVREGRQIGCFVIVAQQQTNATNLPTELRENIPFKLILGSAERQTYITALGVYPDIAKRRFEKGQGLLVYPEIASPELPAVTAIATMDFDILSALDGIKVN